MENSDNKNIIVTCRVKFCIQGTPLFVYNIPTNVILYYNSKSLSRDCYSFIWPPIYIIPAVMSSKSIGVPLTQRTLSTSRALPLLLENITIINTVYIFMYGIECFKYNKARPRNGNTPRAYIIALCDNLV